MRLQTFVLVVLVIGVCVADPLSDKPRKFKKASSEQDKKYSSLKVKLERLQEVEAELEAEIEEELQEEVDSDGGRVSEILDFSIYNSEPDDSEEEEDEDEMEDPCKDLYCGAGSECIITENGEGLCQCREMCENIDDERRKVCSNHNESWPSDCELYRMRCLCAEGSEQCTSDKYENMHIDYYGQCQAVPECKEDELVDFPRRMREWLFNIMRDMAQRKQLSEHFLEMEQIAEEDDTKKAASAAVWKWCELDGHPKDRSVSRHELFPLRAPLYTLEHCISPFLDSCDPNNDNYITLKEWTTCLELTEEHTEDMEELCEGIREE